MGSCCPIGHLLGLSLSPGPNTVFAGRSPRGCFRSGSVLSRALPYCTSLARRPGPPAVPPGQGRASCEGAGCRIILQRLVEPFVEAVGLGVVGLGPRSLAGKPFGLVPHYGKWTYYSLIRQYRARYTCQIPTMTLIIDDKKRAAWGESGFPSKFLEWSMSSTLGVGVPVHQPPVAGAVPPESKAGWHTIAPVPVAWAPESPDAARPSPQTAPATGLSL